jgi:hypothetical protein
MAVVPIKFRCFRCQQLLGVSRSKAGAVVSCTKCGAELIVPDPSDPAPTDQTTTESIGEPTSPGVGAGIDRGISLDDLDIRPEDIRVQPGTDALVPKQTPSFSVAVEELEAEPEEEESPDHVGVLIAEKPIPAPEPASQQVRATEPVVNPPIRIEVPRERTRRVEPAPSVRSRDLTVPRSVMAAWSLFVILALGFAFIAGLLAGHYVWRVH